LSGITSVATNRLHRNNTREERVFPGDPFDLAQDKRREGEFPRGYMRIEPYGFLVKILLIVEELMV
jgi:hypothetical protein